MNKKEVAFENLSHSHSALIALTFTSMFLVIGFFEKNLFLGDDNKGLLQHPVIWCFLLINLILTTVIKHIKKDLFNKVGIETEQKIITSANHLLINSKIMAVVFELIMLVGFMFFVGNSLQNAKLINPLPFDFWDSLNYPVSYIVSRVYKLYLYAYFFPRQLKYIFIFVYSMKKQMEIDENKIKEYPLQNYIQLNELCNAGINVLTSLILPIILYTTLVFFVHDRVDITILSTILVTILITCIAGAFYIWFIQNFYKSIVEHKKHHIKEIDKQLLDIHNSIKAGYNTQNDFTLLQINLAKDTYLREQKSQIEKISVYPLLIKSIITILSPLIPSIIKVLFSFEDLIKLI